MTRPPSSLLIALAALPALGKSLAGAEIATGFDGAPETVMGAPGELKVFDVFVTLTTRNNDSDRGIQGWVLLLRIEGGQFRAVSSKDMVVSTLIDADGDPATPPIEVSDFRLNSGFDKSLLYAVKDGGGPVARGAYVNHVLGIGEKTVELAPEGTQRIARLTIEARVPEDGSCASISLRVIDEDMPTTGGGAATRSPKSIFGGTFQTLVTFQDESRPPVLGSAEIRLCPQSFRRGEVNGDGRTDISDAIQILSYLFLGAEEPSCLDALDANDDGQLALSDAVFLLNDLFGPGAESRVPLPGAFTCGLDPTVDELGCSSSPSCSPPG